MAAANSSPAWRCRFSTSTRSRRRSASRKIARLRRRVQEAVTTLLDRQNPDGSFGLWRAGDGYAQPWLGAYIDRLPDARQSARLRGAAKRAGSRPTPRCVAWRALNEGAPGYQYDVYSWPGSTETASAAAFAFGGLCALYAWPKQARADIGQCVTSTTPLLRDEPSPLARAQIGAALAHWVIARVAATPSAKPNARWAIATPAIGIRRRCAIWLACWPMRLRLVKWNWRSVCAAVSTTTSAILTA